MASKIRFVARACRWFDKVNGNTYHSVRITRATDGAVLVVPFQYGYREHYRQSALLVMSKAKWIPAKYRDDGSGHGFKPFSFERESGYPIEWIVTDGLKRDAVRNGEI